MTAVPARRLKLDESLPRSVEAVFGDAGFDVHTVHEEQLAGRPDGEVAEACRQESRALVTLDRDFADIRIFRPADYAGLVLLRPARQDATSLGRLAWRLVKLMAERDPVGALWVVEEKRIRIHR